MCAWVFFLTDRLGCLQVKASQNVIAHLRTVNEELVAILNTYDQDAAAASAADGAAAEADLPSRRIRVLQASLKQSEDMVQSLEASHKAAPSPAVMQKHQGRIKALEQEAAELQRTNAALTTQLEKAETHLALYDKRLGRGDYNVETTKVVHLAVNPTKELLERKRDRAAGDAQLKAENEALRKKLETLMGTPLSSAGEVRLA